MAPTAVSHAPTWRPGWHVAALLANDVDEHAERLSGWRQRYDQLTPGRFDGRLNEVVTDVGQVYRERTSQALHQQCEAWDDAVWCGLTVVHDGSRIEGREVGPTGAMVCGSGAHFELMSPAGHDLLGVVVGRQALERQAQVQGLPIDWALVDSSSWLDVGGSRRGLALSRLRAILALAVTASGEHRHSPAARDTLQQAMLDAVHDLLAQPRAPQFGRSNATERRRVVKQVYELVSEQTDVVLGVAQLCERLHVSRRTLQYAFEAETAMGPNAYLRSIRLNGVRRALRSGASANVREAAAAWGFWNMSQFAHDYRHQFGERPSDTLLRGAQAAGSCLK
jgi:AraC family transcriptional regulator, ethanolamine operon transcriptional activator